MSEKELMELALDEAGFRRRVQFAMFSVATDKANAGLTLDSDDEAFVDEILNGFNDLTWMAIGVVVTNSSAGTSDDATLKTNVETLWPFYAASCKRGNE